MIRQSGYNDEKTQYSLDMTPMIDVVFTIIAFMMILINTPIVSMDIDLPAVDDTQISTTTNANTVQLHVILDSQNWKIDDGAQLDKAAILRLLLARKAQTKDSISVVIAIDKAAPVQRMIETFDLLEKAKITNVQVMLDPHNDLGLESER